MSDRYSLDHQGLTEQQFLDQYDAGIYERPSVTADMLIFTITDQEQDNYRKLPDKSLQLLLIQRGEHPFMGQWALPGGFVGMKESLDEAAARELRSETGLNEIYMEQLYTWGEVERDPRTRVISTSYMALVDSSTQQVRAGEDAQDARWFELNYRIMQETKTHLPDGCRLEKEVHIHLRHQDIELSGVVKVTRTYCGTITGVEWEVLQSEGIGFDHAKMIAYGVERLRSKIEYTDIVFNLMPPLFTLSALQQVYETILDRELLAPAFRRKIAPRVMATNEYTRDAGHRPSQLYRFRPEWEDA
ncbi:NUDIX hydrolase [Paenibacillus bovis]|uniref:ADP-ribose pyrophosphatase n=1 Tax=Paenibacillus bovis TaxID=1616788 RepID=A0A172ZJA3_9BACL|nr:NUDIX domain-containing protein [Paenibacillus bovis]ANF97357.1 ADP-ribose pyrophosphatase [Paenibacillus bovis]